MADRFPPIRSINDLTEGQSSSFEVEIGVEQLDAFVRVSGDTSPIHVDPAAARARGFPDRVVHGAFLAALVSRMVGTQLPGECALLQRMNLSFLRPVHPGARLIVKAVVEQVAVSVQTAVMKVVIENSLDGQLYARGTVQVGFTTPGA